MKQATGFQLLEMMVVIVIITIVASVTAPRIIHWYQATLSHHVANRLRDSINTARLQALQQQTDVVVCPLADGVCHSNWQQGWNIFVDTNGNKQRDANEPVTQHYLGTSVIQLAFRNRIYRYINLTATGTANFTSIYVCGTDVEHAYYRVVINRSGRARVAIDNSQVC